MGEANKTFSPEGKHAEELETMRENLDATATSLYKRIEAAISKSNVSTKEVPAIILGISTREYVIVPYDAREPEGIVQKVLCYFRNNGWYVEVFNIAASIKTPLVLNRVICVCWDPRIISQSANPRYYSTRSGIRVPCGICRKQEVDGEVRKCTGCLLFSMWVPGIAPFKNFGDPCQSCFRTQRKRSTGCGCLAKRLYEEALQAGEQKKVKGKKKSKDDDDDIQVDAQGEELTASSETESVDLEDGQVDAEQTVEEDIETNAEEDIA